MAHSYKFAIVRFSPNDARDERLNIGLVVFSDSGLDVRGARRIEKVRAISAATETQTINQLLSSLAELDDTLGTSKDPIARHARLNSLGPISLSSLGEFVAEGPIEYEDRVASILKAMVDIEPAGRIHREKRSRLLTQVKRHFKLERVMAKKDEDITSHRVIPSFELDDGLVADFVLKNGAMHVVETVDASSAEESPRKAIADVGVAALVLERARMKFGGQQTKGRLVYSASSALERIAKPSLEAAEHQGAELINWDSADDRAKFIQAIAMLATPLPIKRRRVKFISGSGPRMI